MIGSAIATTIIVISLVAVYIYKNHNQKPGEYIWVGEGENPFKR